MNVLEIDSKNIEVFENKINPINAYPMNIGNVPIINLPATNRARFNTCNNNPNSKSCDP